MALTDKLRALRLEDDSGVSDLSPDPRGDRDLCLRSLTLQLVLLLPDNPRAVVGMVQCYVDNEMCICCCRPYIIRFLTLRDIANMDSCWRVDHNCSCVG